MKCVEGRKHFQGEGVRRENARKRRVFQPAPDVFEREAKSTICGGRGMGRFSAGLFWAEQSPAPTGDLVIPRRRGFPVYIRRSDPAPIGVRLMLL